MTTLLINIALITFIVLLVSLGIFLYFCVKYLKEAIRIRTISLNAIEDWKAHSQPIIATGQKPKKLGVFLVYHSIAYDMLFGKTNLDAAPIADKMKSAADEWLADYEKFMEKE